MAHDVIIALDFENREKTMKFLELFQEEKPFVKDWHGAVLRGGTVHCAGDQEPRAQDFP